MFSLEKHFMEVVEAFVIKQGDVFEEILSVEYQDITYWLNKATSDVKIHNPSDRIDDFLKGGTNDVCASILRLMFEKRYQVPERKQALINLFWCLIEYSGDWYPRQDNLRKLMGSHELALKDNEVIILTLLNSSEDNNYTLDSLEENLKFLGKVVQTTPEELIALYRRRPINRELLPALGWNLSNMPEELLQCLACYYHIFAEELGKRRILLALPMCQDKISWHLGVHRSIDASALKPKPNKLHPVEMYSYLDYHKRNGSLVRDTNSFWRKVPKEWLELGITEIGEAPQYEDMVEFVKSNPLNEIKQEDLDGCWDSF